MAWGSRPIKYSIWNRSNIQKSIYRRPSKFIPNASADEILQAWSAILLPFVSIEFLQMLSTKYRLFLLSNTDAIHIETFEQKMEPLL
jgi:hypothetical protein